MNKAAKTYYKKLYKSFPMMTHLEKDFLKEFKKSLINHASLYPHASIDDYYKKYGQPCDIIATYYEHFESEYITKYMNSRKNHKTFSSHFNYYDYDCFYHHRACMLSCLCRD